MSFPRKLNYDFSFGLHDWFQSNIAAHRTPLLNVLTGKPMFNVLSDDQMGFDLGGVFSLVNLQFKVKNNGLYCLPSCNTDQWKSMWNNMFFQYNRDEPRYKGNPNQVIRDGDQYEPK